MGIIGEIRVPLTENLLVKWRSHAGPSTQPVNRVLPLTLTFKRPYRNCPDHTDPFIPALLLRGSPDRDLSFVGTYPESRVETARP